MTHLGGVQKYWYDLNGNMTTRISGGSTYNFTYDAENRLSGVSGAATVSMVYDGDGNRVKATINGTTTVYVGNYYEKTGSVVKKHYYAGGARVALRDNGTLRFLLSDHLNGTNVTTTDAGAFYASLRYHPWGTVRYANGSTPTKYQFTGQYSFAGEFGLLDYKSRYYDPQLGRFAAPDTIIPQGQGTQAWDRMAYTSNNPIVNIDPSGHDDVRHSCYEPGDPGCGSKTEPIVPYCIRYPFSPGCFVGPFSDTTNKVYISSGYPYYGVPTNPGELLRAFCGPGGGTKTYYGAGVHADSYSTDVGEKPALSLTGATINYGANYNLAIYENMTRLTVNEHYSIKPVGSEVTAGSILNITTAGGSKYALGLGEFANSSKSTTIEFYGVEYRPVDLSIRIRMFMSEILFLTPGLEPYNLIFNPNY